MTWSALTLSKLHKRPARRCCWFDFHSKHHTTSARYQLNGGQWINQLVSQTISAYLYGLITSWKMEQKNGGLEDEFPALQLGTTFMFPLKKIARWKHLYISNKRDGVCWRGEGFDWHLYVSMSSWSSCAAQWHFRPKCNRMLPRAADTRGGTVGSNTGFQGVPVDREVFQTSSLKDGSN